MYQTQTQRSEIKDARHTATLPDRSGMVEKGVAFHEEPSRSMLRSAPIGTSSGGRERVCCWPVGMVGNTTLSPHKIVLAPELLNHSVGLGSSPPTSHPRIPYKEVQWEMSPLSPMEPVKWMWHQLFLSRVVSTKHILRS